MKKPIAILDQFIEKGKVITYMTAYFGKQAKHDDGRMPNAHAVFKIYLKDTRKWYHKIINPSNNWAWSHLIGNQIHD